MEVNVEVVAWHPKRQCWLTLFGPLRWLGLTGAEKVTFIWGKSIKVTVEAFWDMLEHNKDILWATCFPFTLREDIANCNFPLGPTAFHFRPHLGVKRAKMWAGSPCADIAPEKFTSKDAKMSLARFFFHQRPWFMVGMTNHTLAASLLPLWGTLFHKWIKVAWLICNTINNFGVSKLILIPTNVTWIFSCLFTWSYFSYDSSVSVLIGLCLEWILKWATWTRTAD